MTKQLAFSFDVNRCTGCMACVVSCLDQNDLPGGAVSFRHVTKLEQGAFPSAKISFLSLSCQHCGDAPCLMVCPTGAISKRDDGVVVVNRSLCVGCHSCVLACPFGAPQFEHGTMSKCDFCHARMDFGMEPACVSVCPTNALGFGNIEELTKTVKERAAVTILSSLLTTGSR